MSATSAPSTVHIDEALDQVQRHRERVLAEAPGVERSTRIAALYEREACLWSALFEFTRTRVYWRAALAAEIRARQLAWQWRRHAIAEAQGLPTFPRLGGCGEVRVWADRWQAEIAGGAS